MPIETRQIREINKTNIGELALHSFLELRRLHVQMTALLSLVKMVAHVPEIKPFIYN